MINQSLDTPINREIDAATEKIIREWHEHNTEAGQIAQQQEDCQAGYEYLIKKIGAIVGPCVVNCLKIGEPRIYLQQKIEVSSHPIGPQDGVIRVQFNNVTLAMTTIEASWLANNILMMIRAAERGESVNHCGLVETVK